MRKYRFLPVLVAILVGTFVMGVGLANAFDGPSYYDGNITEEGNGGSYSCSDFFPNTTGTEMSGNAPNAHYRQGDVYVLKKNNGIQLLWDETEKVTDFDNLVGVAMKAGPGFNLYEGPFSEGDILLTPENKDISHIVFCWGKSEEPPPCEDDEPCWCEPGGPGYPCEPPPVCNTARLWSETQFEYGFTRSTEGQAGLGCSGNEVIQAGVDEQVRFDVCLDGNVEGILVTPDSLPYYDEEFVTVKAEQQQVTGGVTVLIEDAEVEGCSITATYRWAGVVAADTDTEVCLPDEPCWCEQFPDLCDKETPCDTSAGLQIAVVPGWVEAEECYEHLKNTQELEASIPGDLTLCWRGQGGPNLKVRGHLNGNSFNNLPVQGSTWIGGDFDLDGYLSATARDGDCSSGLYVPFLVHRTPPGICQPWLP